MNEREIASIQVPIPKVNYLKKKWMDIYTPLVSIANLEVRMNLSIPSIDLRLAIDNENIMCLEKGKMFINLILLGFTPQEAILALKEECAVNISFTVKDIKKLSGHNLERAVGRVVGREGKIKEQIEQSSRTKIVIKNDTFHILGSEEGVKLAKDGICRLVMGANPGSIQNKMRRIAKKMKEECFLV
ncbi:KH domain containing protein [Spraguea lophii 42_110]|uniref:Pre-rRNA-processing protein PNO1 n=1 Tax=Spraguea lophii (strain 42_110) TaxID=1358809 RepID=S7W9U0_SPRLO|nr:KH domain containing protein [Spraguea lophii 42_110]